MRGPSAESGKAHICLRSVLMTACLIKCLAHAAGLPRAAQEQKCRLDTPLSADGSLRDFLEWKNSDLLTCNGAAFVVDYSQVDRPAELHLQYEDWPIDTLCAVAILQLSWLRCVSAAPHQRSVCFNLM
jgi:hypothetical protein